jgi:hypothetical protein
MLASENWQRVILFSEWALIGMLYFLGGLLALWLLWRILRLIWWVLTVPDRYR